MSKKLLYKKIQDLKKSVPYLQKSTRGHYGKFVEESMLLAAIDSKCHELGLLIIPSAKGRTVVHEGVIVTSLDFEFTIADTETGEEIKLDWYADSAVQSNKPDSFGSGKCATYGTRYFLLKFLGVATGEDDPELFSSKADKLRDKIGKAATKDELKKQPLGKDEVTIDQMRELRTLMVHRDATKPMISAIKSKLDSGITKQEASELISKARKKLGLENKLSEEDL